MNKNTIVVLDSVTMGDVSVLERFKDFGELTIYQSTSAEQTVKHIGNANIVITNKVIFDANILQSCKSLKLICLTATGMNNVDLDFAKKQGIQVKNVAGYSTESVAQHTFALLLSFLHSTAYYNNYVQSGVYSESGIFTHMKKPYWELSGKKWGIIGMGAIGRRVAQIATAFGAEVSYFSTSGKNNNQDYKQVSLLELMRNSDVISIHSPLNEDTLNLISYKELLLCKKNAVLVNVGRGGIVNEADLAQALLENKIAGACLDVMEKEPLPNNSPLLNPEIKDKLLITPHTAWISNEALNTLFNKVYDNIVEFLS